MKKYELTDETKLWCGHPLHRIRALRDFGDVKAGDMGGWIETEDNLDHDGGCWVYGNAKVCGNALVCGNAWVYGNAKVYDNAWVCGGVWDTSPLYIQGTKWSVNVASETEVQIGCQCYTWEEWHDRYAEIAAEHDGGKLIAEYVEYFNLCCRRYGREDCVIVLEERV